MVSIVVPVYNASEFIEETIESVIDQTYEDWELILINDGSKDDSVEKIKNYKNNSKITLLEHPNSTNLGVSKSRERGIKAAKGDFIAFLDADDVFYSNKLRAQLDVFSRFEEVVLIHSRVDILNNSRFEFNNDFALAADDRIYELHEKSNWLQSNEICNSTVMVKSSIVKNIQFGLPQLFQFEDWLLWCLIANKGKFYYQNNSQIRYRVHPKSATASILEKGLVYPYSKIEFLISLYLLSQHNSIYDSKIIVQLKESLVELSKMYSGENGGNSKIKLLQAELFKGEIKEIDQENKYHLYDKNEDGKNNKFLEMLKKLPILKFLNNFRIQ